MSHPAHAGRVDAYIDAAELEFPERCLRIGPNLAGFRECGRGPRTVVLLHGISSGAASWAQCAHILGRHARVIAWDAPGYGVSSPLPMDVPSALDYAHRLASLLNELDVSRCVVVGHSLGALMAAAYGTLPDQRARLSVLISPALGYGAIENRQLAEQIRTRRLEALEREGLEAIAQKLPARLLTSSASAGQRATVIRNALRLNGGGYRQAVQMLCSENIEQYVRRGHAARVYCAEHDIVTPPGPSQDFARRAGLPFGLVKDAGHACYVEQPEQVAGILSTLVLGSDGPDAG